MDFENWEPILSSSTLNPFLNKLILENIFSHLDTHELLKARLVCKLWNQEANRFLQIRMLVNFSGSNVKHIYSFLKLMKPYYNNQSNEDDEDPDTLSLPDDMVPFGRFSIQIWDSESYRSRFVSLPDYSEAFFNNYGQYVKYLQISFNDFKETVFNSKYRDWFLMAIGKNLKVLELNGLSSFAPLTQQLENEFIFEDESTTTVQILPNLHTLLMTDCFSEEDQEQDVEHAAAAAPGLRKRFGTRFILDILRMAPNLISLTINTMENVSSSLTSSTVQMLAHVQPDKLKHLHLQTYITEVQLNTIHSCHFKLKSCQLQFLNIDFKNNGTCLMEFMRAQSDTLSDLVLELKQSHNRALTDEETLHLNFPVPMKKLVSLDCTGPICVTICEHRSKSDCKLMLPHVQKLLLWNNTKFDLCPNHHEVFVNTLYIPATGLSEQFGGEEEGVFKEILLYWKWLRCIRLESPTPDMLRLLWNHGVAIEELELELQLKGQVQEQSALLLDTKYPAIFNLTKLRKLSISSKESTTVLEVPDEFIHAVVGNLKHLTSLSLRNTKISDFGLRYITEHAKHIYLDI